MTPTTPPPNRIRELRKQRGWSASQLAEAVGTSYQQIYRLEHGERRLTLDWMQRLARALEVPPEHLMPSGTRKTLDSEFVDLEIRGSVHTGKWSDRSELQSMILQTVRVPRPSDDDDLFVLICEDPAMDREYPNGTLLVCGPVTDHRQPISGDHVVVERRDSEGKIERQLREWRTVDGIVWLWPHSTHPDHAAPRMLDTAPNALETVTAIVLAEYRIRRRSDLTSR